MSNLSLGQNKTKRQEKERRIKKQGPRPHKQERGRQMMDRQARWTDSQNSQHRLTNMERPRIRTKKTTHAGTMLVLFKWGAFRPASLLLVCPQPTPRLPHLRQHPRSFLAVMSDRVGANASTTWSRDDHHDLASSPSPQTPPSVSLSASDQEHSGSKSCKSSSHIDY